MTTLRDIAAAIQGNLIGDGDIPIHGIAGIQTATEGQVSFVTHRSYLKHIPDCRASALIIGKKTSLDEFKGKNVIVVDNPELAYITVAGMFLEEVSMPAGIDPLAFVSPEATVDRSASVGPFACIERNSRIGANVTVYPFSYIGPNVAIGEGSVIYPHVTIYRDTTIGKNVIIHANTVIAGDGFGYTWDGSKHAKIPQLGSVIIEDDVEIGANTAIDRASLEKTLIGKGTKIDNLVQVAHNVTIGQNSIIVSQVGIAGSAHIGNNVVLAGQAGVRDHVTVGDQVMAGGQTGITRDVPPGSLIWGTPHMPHKEWMKLQLYIRKLPALFEKIKEMEKKLLLEDKDG
ncbi:MAG TPA: UDP-3-O-(3-hydroxymyristoyl)glucosamine N-acyltransferase [Deltaproteobacteria bacterium]|nr:UDP-3-O-(3-hydroxymyristoyl)glucosamine N-acyltransferase [Deltaproteobacteria bacterium]